MSDAGFSVGDELNNADCKAAQARDVFGAVARTDTTSIFIEIPIDHIVAAILNCPMAVIQFEDTLRTRLIGRTAGHSQGNFSRDFPVILADYLPLNQEYLSDMREVEIGVERGTAPDTPGLDSPMGQW